MTVVALDVGDRRIGIAVSDPTELLARPHGVIGRRSNILDSDEIARVVALSAARAVLVGLPLSSDDKVGEQARHSLAFARVLRRKLGIPVIMWDERFSTTIADRRMVELGVGKNRRHQLIDAAAAAVILDDWLTGQRSSSPSTRADTQDNSSPDLV